MRRLQLVTWLPFLRSQTPVTVCASFYGVTADNGCSPVVKAPNYVRVHAGRVWEARLSST